MRFDDIIEIKDYRSPESLINHPRMKRAERAKIFSPFAALRGYEDSIQEEIHKTSLCRRPFLSDSEKASIDECLRTARKGDPIKAMVFIEEDNGYGEIEEISGSFIKADAESMRIVIKQDSELRSFALEDLIKAETLED